MNAATEEHQFMWQSAYETSMLDGTVLKSFVTYGIDTAFMAEIDSTLSMSEIECIFTIGNALEAAEALEMLEIAEVIGIAAL